MFNILISSEDRFYVDGLDYLLREIVSEIAENIHTSINCHTADDIGLADIIVMDFIAGQSVICHRAFQVRKKNSLIIGLYEGEHSPEPRELPLCLSNTLFIKRSEPVASVISKIKSSWNEYSQREKRLFGWRCHECRHRSLSPQQIRLARYFYRGAPTQEIAREMNIKPKTVAVHKRTIMKKFSLENDCELMKLLQHLRINVTCTTG